MVFATLAFRGALGADQGLPTYFADLSGPGLPYCTEGRGSAIALKILSAFLEVNPS